MQTTKRDKIFARYISAQKVLQYRKHDLDKTTKNKQEKKKLSSKVGLRSEIQPLKKEIQRVLNDFKSILHSYLSRKWELKIFWDPISL